MTPGERGSHRVAAVVGLLCGLALLLGAVVDGGLSTPTRTDPAGAAAAVPHGDLVAPSAEAREDHPAWGHTVPPGRIAVIVLAGLVALAAASTREAGPRRAGLGHRAPALRTARHRGPPAVV